MPYQRCRVHWSWPIKAHAGQLSERGGSSAHLAWRNYCWVWEVPQGRIKLEPVLLDQICLGCILPLAAGCGKVLESGLGMLRCWYTRSQRPWGPAQSQPQYASQAESSSLGLRSVRKSLWALPWGSLQCTHSQASATQTDPAAHNQMLHTLL